MGASRPVVSSKHGNFAAKGCVRPRQFKRGAPGGGLRPGGRHLWRVALILCPLCRRRQSIKIILRSNTKLDPRRDHRRINLCPTLGCSAPDEIMLSIQAADAPAFVFDFGEARGEGWIAAPNYPGRTARSYLELLRYRCGRLSAGGSSVSNLLKYRPKAGRREGVC